MVGILWDMTSDAPSGPLVVTVDAEGRPRGTADRLLAHTAPGIRHLAFSAVVFDPAGRMLLQRRALDKPTFGGCWANACCSHPRPGEDVIEAARRRVSEELGVVLEDPVVRGSFSYTATDPVTGMVESEFDVVVAGTISGPLRVDPTEVAEISWFSQTDLAGADLQWAPWLEGVLRIVDWRL